MIHQEMLRWGFPNYNGFSLTTAPTKLCENLEMRRLSQLSHQFCVLLGDTGRVYIILINNFFVIFHFSPYTNINLLDLINFIYTRIDKRARCQNHSILMLQLLSNVSISELLNGLSGPNQPICQTLKIYDIKQRLLNIHKLPTFDWIEFSSHSLQEQFPNHIREDRPILDKNPKLVEKLNDIEQQISHLVDAFSGPIVMLNVSNISQIPLAHSTCSMIKSNVKDGLQIYRIHCFGLSAREARNQMVLVAIEQYVSGMVSQDFKSICCAGWSVYEALFQGVRKHFKSRIFQSKYMITKTVNLYKIQKKKNSAIAYLLTLLESDLLSYSVSLHRVHTALYLCSISSEKFNIVEVGITAKHALIHALTARIMAITQAEHHLSDGHIAVSWESITRHRIVSFIDFATRYFRVVPIRSENLVNQRKVNRLCILKLLAQ